MSASHLPRFLGFVLIILLAHTRGSLAQVPQSEESLRAQVQEKLSAIERETQRLQQLGDKNDADALAATLKALRDKVEGKDAPAPTDLPEVHVVGLYEGTFPDGPRKFGHATVDLQVTDRPVILVLCAYEPIRWTLRLADGVKIERLILAGNGEQELAQALPKVPVEKHTRKAGGSPNAFHTHREDHEGYPEAQRIVRQLTGSDITTFTGSYRYSAPFVVGPANPQWQLKRALSAIQPVFLEATAFQRAQTRQLVADLRFQGIYWKSPDIMRPQAFLAEFTPAGPIESSFQPIPSGINRLAADPRGPQWYGTLGHASLMRVDLKANISSKFEIEGDLPELSWPDGLAWDSKRNRLIVTSHGNVGYMYAYQPDTNEWSLVTDMGNTDLCSFIYSPEEDCFYGLVHHLGKGELGIRQYAPNGTAGPEIKLERRIGENDRMMIHQAPPQLIAAGKHLVILFPPSGPRNAATGPMSCVVIDPKTRKTIFTGDCQPRAAANRDMAPAKFERLWDALSDNATAHEAELALAAGGDGTVKLLGAKLPPLAPIDPQRIQNLITQLDADAAQQKEQAMAELTKLAPLAEPELKKALAGKLSDDARTRLEVVLREAKAQLPADHAIETITDPGLRREARAIRILGLIGTPSAADFLRHLTRGPSAAPRIQLAKAALRRF
jgi:hypothetical protein